MGHADASDHAGCANGTGADAYFDDVRAGVDERQGAFRGGDVAGDEWQAGKGFFDFAHGVQHAFGMAMRGINGDDIHTGLNQSADPVEHVVGHANRRANQEIIGFYAGNLLGLGGNTHVLMDNAQTAFLCDSACHICFGDSIHTCADKRDFKAYVPGKLDMNVYVTGQNFGVPGKNENIIKSQSVRYGFHGKSFVSRKFYLHKSYHKLPFFQ